MIELVPGENDAAGFLSLAQRIVNGALIALEAREVFLVHTDNWFDWKWLGFPNKRKDEHCVPPFNPNRIRSEKHFLCNESGLRWAPAGHSKPLHVRQPGPGILAPETLDRWSKSAAFIWYSGNSITNRAGSLMLHLSGAEKYAWYASFKKDGQWKVNGERGIARRELVSFEERGRHLELELVH